MDIDGECHCGFIHFRARVDPERVSICHCTDCQALTGSPYRVTVLTRRSDFELTGGTPKVYIKTGDNGLQRLQHFCPECGTPMFANGNVAGDDEWGIRWGSVRQRAQLPPRRQIWCSSAAPWIHDLAGLPAQPRGTDETSASR